MSRATDWLNTTGLFLYLLAFGSNLTWQDKNIWKSHVWLPASSSLGLFSLYEPPETMWEEFLQRQLEAAFRSENDI